MLRPKVVMRHIVGLVFSPCTTVSPRNTAININKREVRKSSPEIQIDSPSVSRDSHQKFSSLGGKSSREEGPACGRARSRSNDVCARRVQRRNSATRLSRNVFCASARESVRQKSIPGECKSCSTRMHRDTGLLTEELDARR